MSYDPYAPPARRKGAARVHMAPPPDPADAVPGHEDEAIAWMYEGPRGNLVEFSRRVDLVEAAETARPGRMRPRVMDAISAARVAITTGAEADDETVIGGLDSTPDSRHDEFQTVEPAGATRVVANPPAGEDPPDQPEAETGQGGDSQPAHPGGIPPQDVPSTATAVVTWIRDAGDDAGLAARRSQAAWAIEVARSDGVRTTVKAEIDKHLD